MDATALSAAEKTWAVLVVDDEAEARERVSDLLTVAGFSTLTAPNGARALDMLRAVPGRCLILLDLEMPVMSGEAFLDELLKLPRSATRFPVVVMSGRPDAALTIRRPCVVGLLSKPFAPGRLIEVVREHVNPVGSPMR